MQQSEKLYFLNMAFPFTIKTSLSECRLMYGGAHTCCQEPYALAVICDHLQHPRVIYNSARTNVEDEYGVRCMHRQPLQTQTTAH